jgi:hypothetical protein
MCEIMETDCGTLLSKGQIRMSAGVEIFPIGETIFFTQYEIKVKTHATPMQLILYSTVCFLEYNILKLYLFFPFEEGKLTLSSFC